MTDVKLIAVLAVTIAVLAGGALGASACERTVPDMTGLDLDQYGADAARVTGTGATRIPDITALYLDQHGADIVPVTGQAALQTEGTPLVVASNEPWIAGPHDVAGGNEGPSRSTAASGH